jgi:AcrR family transcriptional regulator
MEDREMISKISSLFHRYGIKSVTMDDVAHELSISKKTLYEHYSDKSHLVHAVIEHEFSCLEKKFKSVKEEPKNAMDEIFIIYRHHAMMIKEHHPSFEFDLKKYYPEIYAGLRKDRRAKVMEATLKNLKKGKSEGLYRADLNENLIAKLNMMRIECITENDLFSIDELYSQEYSLEIFIYHLHGILSEKGLKYLEQNIDKLKNVS